MTTNATIRPEDCPEPFWHETHRCCPACSWTEPQEEVPICGVMNDAPNYERLACGLKLGHDGPHAWVQVAVAEIFHGAHVGWIDAAGVTGELRGKANSLGGPCDECQSLARLVVEEVNNPTEGERP